MNPTLRTAPLWPLLVAATLGLGLTAPAEALELRVEVLNTAADGPVNAALFNGPADWLKTPFQAQRQAAGATTVLVYKDLAPGSYALSLFQDSNNNGRFDRNPAGMPLEPFGFSRDAMGSMGPPAFDAAAIDLRADTTIKITLR